MMLGSRAHAQWELEVARTILGDKKRILLLLLLTVRPSLEASLCGSGGGSSSGIPGREIGL